MLHNFPSMYIYCLTAMQCNTKHEKTQPQLYFVLFSLLLSVPRWIPPSLSCIYCCCCTTFTLLLFFPRIFFHCTYGAYGIHTTKGHFYLSYAFSEHRFPSILCLFCVFLLLFFSRLLGKWKTALFMAVCNDDDLMMTNLVRSERRHE